MKSLKIKPLLCLFSYLHLVSAQPLLAAQDMPVFVQSQYVNDSEFKAFVRNSKSAISLSDSISESSPTTQDRSNLLRVLESAQHEYLGGSFDKAREYFKTLTSLSRNADWSLEERKTIFYAYLRLAHMSKENLERRTWITEAVRFDSDLKPDKKIFPPPLRKEVEDIRKEELFNSKTWDISRFKENIVAIKVNGKKYNTQFGGSITLMNGLNRIVFISNKNLPIIRTLNAKQALALTIPEAYFNNGTCEHPNLENWPTTQKNKIIVYYSEECLKTYSNGNWQDESALNFMQKQTSEASLASNVSNKNRGSNQVEEFSTKTTESKKSDGNSKLWLLGIVATGIVAAIIINNNRESSGGTSNDDTTKQPTHQ